MTGEEFAQLKAGDEVDVLTLDLERSFVKRIILRKVPKGIAVDAPSLKKKWKYITNPRRVEVWS